MPRAGQKIVQGQPLQSLIFLRTSDCSPCIWAACSILPLTNLLIVKSRPHQIVGLAFPKFQKVSQHMLMSHWCKRLWPSSSTPAIGHCINETLYSCRHVCIDAHTSCSCLKKNQVKHATAIIIKCILSSARNATSIDGLRRDGSSWASQNRHCSYLMIRFPAERL